MRPGFSSESIAEHTVLPDRSGTDAQRSLLVVDDDPQMLQTLACYFEQRDFRVVTATTITEAQTVFPLRRNWLLILSDNHLPDGTGAELRAWAAEQSDTPTPFLLMSGRTEGEALSDGTDFLAKPFSIDALQERVNAALSGRRA